MKRIAAVLVSMVVLTVAPAAQAAGASCADRFPETEWQTVSTGAITVETTGVPEGIAQRLNGEVRLVESWLVDEIGPVSATVCLVDNESAFDTSRWVSGSQRFHARAELEEGLIVINTQRVGFVGPAVAYSLAHQALWQYGQEGGHPEPISHVIGQWYRARILDRLELYHRDVMFDNFFDTEAVIVWTESTQEPIRSWDPERNFQAIGDFVDFAVSEYGNEVLLETSGERWSTIEGEWRAALRADLTGRSTPTTEWIAGIAISILVVVVAVTAAVLGIWSKRRRRRRPPTPGAVPGFFSES